MEQTSNERDERRGSADTTPPRIDSGSLLRGARELEIEHEGAVYRLRVTGRGKLILTK